MNNNSSMSFTFLSFKALRCFNAFTIYLKGETILLLILLPSVSIGQIKIEGKIQSNNLPVAFCSIYFSKFPNLGVLSNESGEYILQIPDSLLNEQIKFSAIGFTTYEVICSTLVAQPHVVLEEFIQILKEVEVRSTLDEAGAIAEKAFSKYDANFPNDIHTLKGFYREVSFNKDSSYLWLLEADLTVQDFSYRKDAEKARIQLNELRRSDDNRTKIALVEFVRKFIPKFIDQNNMYRTYQSPIRNYHHETLRIGESFVRSHNFYIEAYLKHDADSSVIISYESIYNHSKRSDTGRITINLKDYSIIQLEDFVDLYGAKYYSLAKFKKVNGRYYPEFIKEISPGKDDYDNEIQVRTISFYEIITSKPEVEKVRKRNTSKKDESLDNLTYTYNDDFWNGYEVYKDSKLPPKIIGTLERIRPLNSQFKENSKLKAN
jgi:hypothetical protein